MKQITSVSPFYPPFTLPTINSYFLKIFTPLSNRQSVTLRAAPKFGGAMRLVRYLISDLDQLSASHHLNISHQSHCFITIDQEDLLEGNSFAYYSLIARKLSQVLKKPLRADQYHSCIDLVEVIKTLINQILKNQDIVFVIRGIGYLEFADKYLWGSLKSFRPQNENRDRVLFWFVMYQDAPEDINHPKFVFIDKLLRQNLVEYNAITPQDVDYLIYRWAYLLDIDFSASEVDAIKHVSQNNPNIIKYACFNLQHRPQSEPPLSFLQKNTYILNFSGLTSQQKNLNIDSNYGQITINGQSLISDLSPGECELLFFFNQKRGQLVTKEEIANCIWAGEGEDSYSDWAITQTIKRLRTKLSRYGLSPSVIKTVRGRGYLLV